jgi:uncharacterized protein (TIGR02246 family)
MSMSLEEAIDACLKRIQSAWNAGDARLYAAEFTEDATYVIFLGEALSGRRAIETTHVDVFTKWRKGEQMAVKPISIRPLGDGVVSVLTAGGLGKEDPIKLDKLQTFTFVLRDGRWLCAAFQNTLMSADAARRYNS